MPLIHSRPALGFFILWLCGISLRLTILALPPVLPLIHADLELNATSIGLLNGLPPLFLACASLPGSLLIARLGVGTALVSGLFVTGLAGAARGLVHSVVWLDVTTAAMAIGVAIGQVAMPSAVRDWTPKSIGFGTAVYTNGLLLGEILPVALMYPIVLPFVSSWQGAFVFWSMPVFATILLLRVLAGRQIQSAMRRGSNIRWWPNWRDPLTWRLGVMFGTANAVYFATNGFLPDFLTWRHEENLIPISLTALNLSQIPASFLLLSTAKRIKHRNVLLTGCGVLILTGTILVVFTGGIFLAAGASIIGFAAASCFILLLAVPPLISHPHDVHRLTAAMFTISYTLAVLVPLVSGAAWDLTGIGAMAFAPIAICGAALIVIAFTTKVMR